MPKLQDFRIDFDRPGSTYAPGEVVSGRLFLRLSGPKNIKEIRLEACGEAQTHWTKARSEKDSSGRSHTRIEDYKGNEHYFSVTNRLLGIAMGDEQTTLASGEHSYHFSFQLPLNVPCSIEHSLGYVRYTVKVTLSRPWRFDHKVVSAFSVIAPYDLNSQHELSVGLNEEFRRNFRYWCIFSDGGVNLSLKTRVKGFVPGETIELLVAYDNNSTRVDLNYMKLKLEKNLIFHTTSPNDKKNVSEIAKKAKLMGPFPKKGETTVKIEVPPLPPSRLEHCSLIDVDYKLHFVIGVSGLRFPIKRSIPVEIGTVPIYGRVGAGPAPQTPGAPYLVPSAPPIEQVGPLTPASQQVAQAPALQPIGFFVMGASPSATSSPQPVPDLHMHPPPSYEECISGGKTIADSSEQGMHGANVPFAPRYPVYRLPMPMPMPYPS